MTRKSPYPTRADYPALIENAKPALRELLEAASYERRIAVLNECSLDVVNTVCTIMVLGRHSLYLRRKKPFNAPDAVFVRWAADLWTLREQDKAGDIRYLCGKTALREYNAFPIVLFPVSFSPAITVIPFNSTFALSTFPMFFNDNIMLLPPAPKRVS